MRRVWRVSAVVLSAIALTVGTDRAYCAADYAREARLAQEIVPAIVVGDHNGHGWMENDCAEQQFQLARAVFVKPMERR